VAGVDIGICSGSEPYGVLRGAGDKTTALYAMPARAIIDSVELKMAKSISVRKIDDQLYERLQQRAAKEGVSMEEEVRRILRRALSTPEQLGSLAVSCFKNVELEFELPERPSHSPISFD
jgi:antitoxin FitA